MRENNLGLKGYSTEIGAAQYITFSSFYERHEVVEYLNDNDINFKEVIGSYRGDLEMSYMINMADFETLLESDLLADQETVFHVGTALAQSRRKAHLWYMSSDGTVVVNVEKLGTVRSCNQQVAYTQDSWTFCPTLNTFFITENDDAR